MNITADEPPLNVFPSTTILRASKPCGFGRKYGRPLDPPTLTPPPSTSLKIQRRIVTSSEPPLNCTAGPPRPARKVQCSTEPLRQPTPSTASPASPQSLKVQSWIEKSETPASLMEQAPPTGPTFSMRQWCTVM